MVEYYFTDFGVSMKSSIYNTSENIGYVMVCVEITMGALSRPAIVYLSTINGTATGNC